jgi:hypothetical protein
MDHHTDQLKRLPVMRSRNRSGRSQRSSLVGRLHEMAISPVRPAAPVWWQRPHQGGQALIPVPQMVVRERLGRAKSTAPVPHAGGSRSALARWLCFEAMRRSDRPVVVLDGTAQWAAQGEPLDISARAGRVIDPLTFGEALSGPAGNTDGELCA